MRPWAPIGVWGLAICVPGFGAVLPSRSRKDVGVSSASFLHQTSLARTQSATLHDALELHTCPRRERSADLSSCEFTVATWLEPLGESAHLLEKLLAGCEHKKMCRVVGEHVLEAV